MPKKKIAKSKALSQNTLIGLAVFFMLFAVFATIMYYRQVAEMQAFVRLQNQQRNALLFAAPAPSPSPTMMPRKK